MPARTFGGVGAESSLKRSRPPVSFLNDDDDGDRIVDVQRAQSSLRGDTTVSRCPREHATCPLPCPLPLGNSCQHSYSANDPESQTPARIKMPDEANVRQHLRRDPSKIPMSPLMMRKRLKAELATHVKAPTLHRKPNTNCCVMPTLII